MMRRSDDGPRSAPPATNARNRPPFDPGSAVRWYLDPALGVFDGDRVRRDALLEIDRSTLARILPHDRADPGLPRWAPDALASPGFVDLQVNGGGGALLNNTPDAEGVRTIVAAHRRSGTTRLLPTVITDAPETLERACEAVLACRGDRGVAGVHIEGPHIAPERRGTHAADRIRPFDGRTMALVRRLREKDLLVLLTLAPERVPPGLVAELRALGVVVSAGHTAANADEIDRAVGEGLSMFTHLFNAMTPMASRAPGVVGAALDSDAWCGLIVDGHHVDDRVVGIALRSRRRPGRTFAVSDAMATVNGPDAFELYGRTIRVEGGRLVNAEGALAGAHLDLLGALRRLVQRVGVPLDEALRMVTSVPAEAMALGHDAGKLVEGLTGELVLVDRDLRAATVLDLGRSELEAPSRPAERHR